MTTTPTPTLIEPPFTTILSVSLVDHMGDDNSVVNAARVSFEKEASAFTPEQNNKLIQYLAEHKHMLPFAHTSITLRCKAPIFLARQLGKHQVGMCLSEDTDITFVKRANGSSNGTSKRKLSHLADMWFGKIKYHSKSTIKRGNIRTYNEETGLFEDSHIVDVIDSGFKQVFLLEDEFGNTIEATEDHKFFTNLGWVPLKDLTIGTHLLVRDDCGLSFNCTESKRCDSEDVICRREFRALNIINGRGNCNQCLMRLDSKELEVDHIDPVSNNTNHSSSNLQLLCKSCHRKKSNLERTRGNSNLRPKYVSIKSIKENGFKQCYDLTIDKNHNFLGNGFLVHNCWNEVSRRYVDSEPEFFVPELRKRAPNKKQGSLEETVDASEELLTYYKDTALGCLATYEDLLQGGVAPEIARSILPQNMMTEWIWTGSLLAFMRVYDLRIGPHAQKEAQVFAEALLPVLESLFPVSVQALKGKQA